MKRVIKSIWFHSRDIVIFGIIMLLGIIALCSWLNWYRLTLISILWR